MDSFELSCAIIELAGSDNTLNNIELNALCYLGYVDWLKEDKKLFDDKITAAKYGVFIKQVKDHFWPFIVDDIPTSPLSGFSDEVKNEAQRIWDKYKDLSQDELHEICCGEGTAWEKARRNIENEYLPVEISDEDIKNSKDFE